MAAHRCVQTESARFTAFHKPTSLSADTTLWASVPDCRPLTWAAPVSRWWIAAPITAPATRVAKDAHSILRQYPREAVETPRPRRALEPRQYFSKSRDAPGTRPSRSSHLPEHSPSSGANSFRLWHLRLFSPCPL
eukprot:scaffold141625_cov145-Phaeocystis_antarctica.AAC.2